MRINLGTITIQKEIWARCKARGYTRDDVKQVIIQNGEESLHSALDCTMICQKCGLAASGSSGGSSCEHDWVQE